MRTAGSVQRIADRSLGKLTTGKLRTGIFKNVQKRSKTVYNPSTVRHSSPQASSGQDIQKLYKNRQKLDGNGQKLCKIFDTWLVKREAHLDGGTFG
jgi:hypothetical protein